MEKVLTNGGNGSRSATHDGFEYGSINESAVKHIHYDGSEGGNDAYEDDAGDEKACVVVADMSEFMPYNACQFVIIEEIEQSRCHGNGV